MRVDVTVDKCSQDRYVYTMYMCHSPRFGVEQSELCRSDLKFSHAVIHFSEEFYWTYKLLPSESLGIKFAERLRSEGIEPYLCRIAKETS